MTEEVDTASGGPSSPAILHELGLEVMGPGWLLPARFCPSGEKHCPVLSVSKPSLKNIASYEKQTASKRNTEGGHRGCCFVAVSGK